MDRTIARVPLEASKGPPNATAGRRPVPVAALRQLAALRRGRGGYRGGRSGCGRRDATATDAQPRCNRAASRAELAPQALPGQRDRLVGLGPADARGALRGALRSRRPARRLRRRTAAVTASIRDRNHNVLGVRRRLCLTGEAVNRARERRPRPPLAGAAAEEGEMELHIRQGESTGSCCLQCGHELVRGVLHRCSSSIRGYAYVVDTRPERVLALNRMRRSAAAVAGTGRPAAA
jgi:hypothetical protein